MLHTFLFLNDISDSWGEETSALPSFYFSLLRFQEVQGQRDRKIDRLTAHKKSWERRVNIFAPNSGVHRGAFRPD